MSNATDSTILGGDAPFFARKMTRRQKLTSRIWTILSVMVLGLVVVFALSRQWSSASATASLDSPPKSGPLPVITMTAEFVETYPRERHYTGLLRELRRSQISFQRGGELIELTVDEGDVVEAGQVVGRLDDRHIRATQAQLNAQVSEARAVLDELLAGPRQESIAAKRAELRAQRSRVKVLEGQLERRKQLVQSASVSREEYETFLFDFEAAQASADVIERQLDELVAGTRKEQIRAQRARLAQLDAMLTDISHDLEDTALRAPFAGRVSRRMIDEGTVLVAGSPVLELIDDTELEAWIGMPQESAIALQVGENVTVQVSGQMIPAVVQSLAPDVDRTTRTRNVILRLHSNKASVVPGQVVRLAINETIHDPGYWVPTTALSRGTRGLWSVYVVDRAEDKRVITRRDVELLDTVGEQSFVRGTLQAGDEVVASGTHRVVVGQEVTLQTASRAHQAL